MKLKIITPDRTVVDETVEAVSAQAVDGSVGILPRHQPMITPLEISLLKYTKQGKQHFATVMGGLLRTDGETVTVLSEAAETGSQIDHSRAEQAKLRAEARLREQDAHLDVARAEIALKRALLRLKAIR